MTDLDQSPGYNYFLENQGPTIGWVRVSAAPSSAGSSQILSQARVATTANITLSGIQTVDGVLLNVGDIVLVKDQSDAKQNGLYTVSLSTWGRVAGQISSGQYVPVGNEGTTFPRTLWVVATIGNIVFGSTNINFDIMTASPA